jgi:hypothetical protein
MKENSTIDIHELEKQAAHSGFNESYRVLGEGRQYRISVGARTLPVDRPSFFVEVFVYLCSRASQVDIPRLESAVTFLKALQAYGYSLSCEDGNCISAEVTVSRETVSAEYDRVSSMASRVFHEPASSSILTGGKLNPPSP